MRPEVILEWGHARTKNVLVSLMTFFYGIRKVTSSHAANLERSLNMSCKNSFADLSWPYTSEHAGGKAIVFLEPSGGGIRPLLCGSAWKRAFAACAAHSIAAAAEKHVTQLCKLFPNFMQFAWGTKDGTILLATLVRSWYDQALSADPSSHATGSLAWAELLPNFIEIDLKNAFNSACRQAAFDAQSGLPRKVMLVLVSALARRCFAWLLCRTFLDTSACMIRRGACAFLTTAARFIIFPVIKVDSKAALSKCSDSATPSTRIHAHPRLLCVISVIR